ncbi:hypothetical protein, partial [Cellulomonas sp. B6]|uniref:hypothetical protein n=1 Tax=Cellulomonas sp. B6 TaxID=1295626 RepID=UPI000B06DCB2
TPGVPRAFLRQLVVALGMPVCLVGNWVIVASAAWDREPARRGWHDKAPGVPRAFLRQLVVALGMPVCLVGNWVIVASAAWDRE